ncbi:hypothetical protein Tco_0816198, partial [Tanacetum coccineum]
DVISSPQNEAPTTTEPAILPASAATSANLPAPITGDYTIQDHGFVAQITAALFTFFGLIMDTALIVRLKHSIQGPVTATHCLLRLTNQSDYCPEEKNRNNTQFTVCEFLPRREMLIFLSPQNEAPTTTEPAILPASAATSANLPAPITGTMVPYAGANPVIDATN